MAIKLNRRTIMTAGTISLSSALFPSPLFSANQPAASALELLLRIRSSEAGRRTFWWYSGKLYGDRYGEPMRPLFSMQGASQTVAKRTADGGIDYDLTEAGYYCDLRSGEIIEGEVENVFTGEAVTPQHYLSSQRLHFSDALEVTPRATLPPQVDYDGRITGPDIKGGRIWMAEHLHVRIAAEPGGRARISNSMANFEAALVDVEKSEGFVPATMQYTTFNSYRTWMNMGDAKGHVMMRLNALKLDSWGAVPQSLRTQIERDHQGVFGDE